MTPTTWIFVAAAAVLVSVCVSLIFLSWLVNKRTLVLATDLITRAEELKQMVKEAEHYVSRDQVLQPEHPSAPAPRGSPAEPGTP